MRATALTASALLPPLVCLFLLPVTANAAECWENLVAEGHDSKGTQKYFAALAMAENFGEDDPRLTCTLRLLAKRLPAQSALPLILREQTILTKKLGADFPGLATGSIIEARCFMELNRPADAAKLLQRAYQMRGGFSSRKPQFDILNMLGICYEQMGQYQESLRYHAQSLSNALKSSNASDDARAAYHAMAQIYMRHLHQPEQAEIALKGALSVGQRDSPLLRARHSAEDAQSLAEFYAQIGRVSDSRQWFERTESYLLNILSSKGIDNATAADFNHRLTDCRRARTALSTAPRAVR